MPYNLDMVNSVIDVPLFERYAKLRGYIGPKCDRRFINLTIEGTTFSGSASRTTLGNTLRVMLYWSFILNSIKI